MTPPETLEPGTLLGGKFRIVRAIGLGGMGAVYEVRHELTKHRRALKLLHADVRARFPDVVRRFLREASVAGTLGDPHIVETFDAGELPTGEPYVVMELLEGEPLSSRIARSALPIADALEIASQLASAIHVAHEHGIVHRDLKPENVFLCPDPRRPDATFVKVLDFGISKFDPTLHEVDGVATEHGAALGTPYYMSPEQVRGAAELDARTDVYALGVILFEMLAGARPFEATSMQHLVVLIHEGRARPLRELRPDVPQALEAIVRRAMNVDREQRFPSARALGDAIERLAGRATEVSTEGLAFQETLPSLAPPKAVEPLAQTEIAAVATPAELHGDARRATIPTFVWVTGAIAVSGIVGGVLLLRGPSTTAKPSIRPVPAASAPAAATTNPTSPYVAGATSSAPASASTSATSSSSVLAPSPPASAPSVTPTVTTTVTKPIATAAPKPSASTKAQKGGLATNPFD